MPSRAVMFFRLSAVSAALALASCGGGSEANGQSAANDADPALTAALEDQILTDPELAQQSNWLAIRPPELPTRAEYPVPVQRASMSATPGCSGCAPAADLPRPSGSCGAGGEFAYGMEWAQRLPAAFPPYPGGRVTEAAGQDRGDCRVRVVTFRTGDPYQRVLDWYRQRAVSSGFSAEHQVRGADHVLGGVNQGTDGAFYLIVTPMQSGSEVALIVNNGR